MSFEVDLIEAMKRTYRSASLVAPEVLHLVGTAEAERMARRYLSPLGKVAKLNPPIDAVYEGSPLLGHLRERGLMS